MTQTELTILDCGEPKSVRGAFDGESLFLAPDELEKALGWQLKPEGLCRDAVCVPVADRTALVREGSIDLTRFAECIGRPLVSEPAAAAAALGESAAARSQKLRSLDAPDFTLPDLNGKQHSLSDFRGKKVLLVAYASW